MKAVLSLAAISSLCYVCYMIGQQAGEHRIKDHVTVEMHDSGTSFKFYGTCLRYQALFFCPTLDNER